LASSASRLVGAGVDDPVASIIPANRSVRAVTRDGRTIRGRRLNEDYYTIQLIDEQARLVSLIKADLRSVEVIQASSMPSYATTLTADERADLIGYLLVTERALAVKKLTKLFAGTVAGRGLVSPRRAGHLGPHPSRGPTSRRTGLPTTAAI
jgi:hypothetical protein